MARAMVHNKDIAKNLWGEATNTACHIVNIVYFRPRTKKQKQKTKNKKQKTKKQKTKKNKKQKTKKNKKQKTKKKKTPYELWKGRKPNVKYFKIFGNTCFILKIEKMWESLTPIVMNGFSLGTRHLARRTESSTKRLVKSWRL